MDKVRKGIERYLQATGARAAVLSRISGVGGDTISRILNSKQQKIETETWLKLHAAAPDFIPPPPLLHAGQRRLNIEPSVEIIELGPERKVPVFDAGAGPDCFWDDGGYPVGQAEEYIYVPKRESDANTFAVRVHGNSMWPGIEDGNVAVVVPSRRLENGNVCFVTNNNDPGGEKLIRRYYKYGDIVVLKPDNPANGFEIQITPDNQQTYSLYRVTEVRKRF